MAATGLAADRGEAARLVAENKGLRERLETAERNTAQTLARATRLSQVISVLALGSDFNTVVERAAVEVAELFSADIALLLLGPDDELSVEGPCGVRSKDIPIKPFALAGLERLTPLEPVMIGPASEVPLPDWLGAYGAEHVAWARLLVGEESLGVMLLVRREPEPFERSDEKELRAIAYRIALAMENGLLHRQTGEQLARLNRIQAFTTQLAGTLDLEPVGQRVVEMLVSEVPVASCIVLIDREGALVPLARSGCEDDADGLGEDWERFALETPGRPLGCVAVAGAPKHGSERRELLVHLLGLAALAIDKALLYQHSREQARQDSLTGLLGHRVFHELLEELTAADEPFSIVLLDIDDFKQINDLYGHQTGDDALRLVAEALRKEVREGDRVFRVGGEEFCAVLPGLSHVDAFATAERLRAGIASIVLALPMTVSLGVASFPEHALRRDELLARADSALYASKRGGKNRTTIAGAHEAAGGAGADRHLHLALLHNRDPNTVVHSVEVATVAVEIARAMGVADDRLADLRTAARLHDIGKIAVPAEILNKPGPLTADEFRIVQTHPVVGAELLLAWGFTTASRFVLEHHEHYDGSGYPAGLKGEDISLEGRIIHVADAFLAMTLDRPYRRAMDRRDAIDELMRHSGTQFDSDVVAAFVARERSRVPRVQSAS
jgi:diguanylate cyclase (GGDEF)-like protein/putative nucleotidyltransferase with HDIG domain